MEVRGKRVVVVGAKRSGLAAAQLLSRHGASVQIMDSQPLSVEEQAAFRAIGADIVPQTPERLQADIVVLSPGVPCDLPMFVAVRERGIPVIGEVELASYFLKGPVIGITGSNGKTTITALTGHLLRSCGIPCQVGGNIGTAVTSMVESSNDHKWNVLELSSFQLETILQFRAQIAACSNVTPDHLDRHHTFENYANAKARLFETQKAGDIAVLNFDDLTCQEFANRTKATVYWFSSSQQLRSGLWMAQDRLFYNGEPFMTRSEIPLVGLHNVENVMAAALMAHLAGANLDALPPAIRSFPGVEHRIEFVRELDGVKYYNDSKATNVDAALKAINAFSGNLWIILGGKDKGGSYEPLKSPLRKKGKAALLIGSAAELIRTSLDGDVPLQDCGTLAEAVKYARDHAEAGDTVLLAPACASFDQFQNYEERGRTFKRLVAELS